MPRRSFVLRIPDGLITAFLAPRSSLHSSTTKPHHTLLSAGMLAFIKQGLSCPDMDILRCRRLNYWGARISPSSTLSFFLHFLPDTEWCCLGSRASFRFHYHPSSPFVHPHCLLLSSVLSSATITHPQCACRCLCICRRCPLSSPSQSHDNDLATNRHHPTSLNTLTSLDPSSTLYLSRPLPRILHPGCRTFAYVV